MSFRENINQICHKNGTTLTRLVKEMGLSTSKVSRWNDGSLPKESVMNIMAEKLGCSVSDFFSENGTTTERKPSAPEDEDESDLLSTYRSLSRREKHEFMAMVYDFGRRSELAKNTGKSASKQGYRNRDAI